MSEWQTPRRGYYFRKYHGKTLEIIRNPLASDGRRYVAKVDGFTCPHPCHNLNQAKTKAMKWADRPDLPDIAARPPPDDIDGAEGAIVPYVEVLPAVVEPEMMTFQIAGKIPIDRFSHIVNHLQSTIDLLREEGAVAECEIDPPPKVKL